MAFAGSCVAGAFFLVLLVLAGCGMEQSRPVPRRPQSLDNIPYRPLNTLWPDETAGKRTRPASAPNVLPQRYWGCLVHQVQPGDTLAALARQYYGQDKYWRDILTFNQDTLPSPNHLRIGQTVYLPKLLDPNDTLHPRRRPHGYVVDRGDTLAGIAHRFLGDSHRWRDLLAVNHATLANPSQLAPGQTLLLNTVGNASAAHPIDT